MQTSYTRNFKFFEKQETGTSEEIQLTDAIQKLKTSLAGVMLMILWVRGMMLVRKWGHKEDDKIRASRQRYKKIWWTS